jgi:hypothetical protein
MNTRNPGKIRAIGVTVRGVGVVRGYFLNHIALNELIRLFRLCG